MTIGAARLMLCRKGVGIGQLPSQEGPPARGQTDRALPVARDEATGDEPIAQLRGRQAKAPVPTVLSRREQPDRRAVIAGASHRTSSRSLARAGSRSMARSR